MSEDATTTIVNKSNGEVDNLSSDDNNKNNDDSRDAKTAFSSNDFNENEDLPTATCSNEGASSSNELPAAVGCSATVSIGNSIPSSTTTTTTTTATTTSTSGSLTSKLSLQVHLL